MRPAITMPFGCCGRSTTPSLVSFGAQFDLRLPLPCIRSAIIEMCQIEVADAVISTKRSERGDAALNA
jgi:hypothetical protein